MGLENNHLKSEFEGEFSREEQERQVGRAANMLEQAMGSGQIARENQSDFISVVVWPVVKEGTHVFSDQGLRRMSELYHEKLGHWRYDEDRVAAVEKFVREVSENKER